MVRKKTPDKIIRCFSNWAHFNSREHRIFQSMAHESKNIFNFSLFHTKIYHSYSNRIFEDLHNLVINNEIKNIDEFDNKLYDVYDHYYQRFLIIKPFIHHNRKIIYQTVINYIEDIDLVNDNFYLFEEFIYKQIKSDDLLKFPEDCDSRTVNELFYDILFQILKSIYNKNFHNTLNEIKSKKKCTIQDINFINQVKNNEYLFDTNAINEKFKVILKRCDLLKINEKSAIKSDQNYIARIIYKYYKNPKIPSDLMCNIIAKVHQTYSSFLAKLSKGMRANCPKFLPKNGTFILPYFDRSRKEVIKNGKKYYRLTVGSNVATNYLNIIDDNRFVCLASNKENKLYVDSEYLIKLPLNKSAIKKSDNYFYKDYYIPKNSSHILESYYVYIEKPIKLNNDNLKLKLIEIVPIYNSRFFKISYTYEKSKSINRPKKNKVISIDLGIVNLMTIYDPNGRQHIIKGNSLISINKYYNSRIDDLQSKLSKNKRNLEVEGKRLFESRIKNEMDYITGKNKKYIPKRITSKDGYIRLMTSQLNKAIYGKEINNEITMTSSKQIHFLFRKRENKINDYFNKIVNTLIKKYPDCEKVIIGYNKGWKDKVKLGSNTNRRFYQIPYSKLLQKLRQKLEENNQELIEVNESYTSKCDSLALESIEKHEKYLGKRVKRGLFSSSDGKLLNADINGAINIMRKWKSLEGKELKKINGVRVCNPLIIKVRKA